MYIGAPHKVGTVLYTVQSLDVNTCFLRKGEVLEFRPSIVAHCDVSKLKNFDGSTDTFSADHIHTAWHTSAEAAWAACIQKIEKDLQDSRAKTAHLQVLLRHARSKAKRDLGKEVSNG